MVWRIVPGVLVVAAAFYPLADPDMWWHLAAGRLILDGHFPLTNTLSHTFPDYPWRFTQWLFGTLIALAENLGGIVAVQVVVCILAAVTMLLVMETIRRDVPRASWVLAFPLFAVGVLAARSRFVARGDLATLLGLAVVQFLWILRPKRLPLFLFLTGCLWSNLHAGVVFGLIEVGIFGCAALLDRDRKSIRDALVCGVAFFTGSLVNPFFHYPYLYVLENFEIARHFPFPIDELLPPSWRDPQFASLAALTTLGLVNSLLRRRYRDSLSIAAFGALALSAKRFYPFLAVLALPAVVKSFHDWFEFLVARFNPKAIGALLSIPIVAAAFYVGYAEWKSVRPGPGADVRTYPAGAAEFILSKGFTGRMFNDFDHGGYLAWRLFPKKRVFIDGRGNAYPWDHFKQVAGYPSNTIAGVLDRYNVDHAIIPRSPGIVDWGPMFAAIGWELVHIEGAAFLFVRPGSPDAMRAGENVFRLYVPWATSDLLMQRVRKTPREMLVELRRIDPEVLLDVREINLLGVSACLAGDAALASRFLAVGYRLYPEDLPTLLNYADVLALSGHTQEAMKLYLRVIEKDPASESAGKARQRLEIRRTPVSRTEGGVP